VKDAAVTLFEAHPETIFATAFWARACKRSVSASQLFQDAALTQDISGPHAAGLIDPVVVGVHGPILFLGSWPSC
jgi:hypothetical protein